MPFLLNWFEPAFNAFNPFNSLPFDLRWRLLIFQPVVLLINFIKYVPWLFSRRYNTIYFPNRHGTPIRILIFHPPPSRSSATDDDQAHHHSLAPLHVSIHAGGFMGGIPEYNAAFAALLSAHTGAVVILPTYRFAPLHPFPAAIDDIDDVLAWLRSSSHAAHELNADVSLLTVSGFSAGANLALAATQQPAEHSIKASVTFYAPVDLRLPPHKKPKPPGMPATNPIAAILPLSDAYVASGATLVREANMGNPRLHPILAELRTLPERMLFVVPTVDILLHEQLVFVDRLKREVEMENSSSKGDGGRRVVENLLVEGQWHGWVEQPDFTTDTKLKYEAFDAAIEFIRETHRRHKWEWAA